MALGLKRFDAPLLRCPGMAKRKVGNPNSARQQFCGDPFSVHKKSKHTDLRQITKNFKETYPQVRKKEFLHALIMSVNLNLAFLDTRYIIKIFIHALLVKSELNCY